MPSSSSNTTNSQSNTNTSTANMSRTSYAPSTFSETTTVCSLEKKVSPGAASESTERRSLKQKVKRAFRDIGHPPTYRYDLEHGIETPKTVEVGPTGSNFLNQPSRL